MSKAVGNELPAPLFEALRTRTAASAYGRAIVVVTVDEHGWPHPALLSYDDVGASDRKTLRVLTYATSRTTANLLQRNATFVFVQPEFAYYVKGKAKGPVTLPVPPGYAATDVAIEQVLEEEVSSAESGAYIATGITFGYPGGEAAWYRRGQPLISNLLK